MNFLYNGQFMTAIAFCLMINQSTNLTDKCRSTWSQKYLKWTHHAVEIIAKRQSKMYLSSGSLQPADQKQS